MQILPTSLESPGTPKDWLALTSTSVGLERFHRSGTQLSLSFTECYALIADRRSAQFARIAATSKLEMP